MRAGGVSGTNTPRLLILGDLVSRHTRYFGVAEDMADRLQARGYSVLRSSSRRGKLGRLLDRVYTAIARRQEYDVAYVDVFSGRAFMVAEAACWALRRARRPYVLTLHGGNLPQFAQRWPRRVRYLLGSARAVTAPSPYLVQEMAPYRDDVVLLPNAIDLSSYHFRLRDRPVGRLLWLRAYRRLYNPLMAVHVVAALKAAGVDVHLAMYGPDYGDGSLQRCHQAAAQLGVQDRIDFCAGIPKGQVPEALQQGDIFLNTTDFDNTPVSVMEAMASGLCIVSTRAGGIPYLLEQEQEGLLVPLRDPQAMAHAVQRVLTDPDLARRLSQSARRKAETCDWEPILAKWDEVFRNAARERENV